MMRKICKFAKNPDKFLIKIWNIMYKKVQNVIMFNEPKKYEKFQNLYKKLTLCRFVNPFCSDFFFRNKISLWNLQKCRNFGTKKIEKCEYLCTKFVSFVNLFCSGFFYPCLFLSGLGSQCVAGVTNISMMLMRSD